MGGRVFQFARGLAAAKKGQTYSLGYSAAGTVSPTTSGQCIAVMLRATTDCYVDINRTGTTVTTAVGHMLPASETQTWVAVGGKELVSVMMNTVQGKVWITELVSPGVVENY